MVLKISGPFNSIPRRYFNGVFDTSKNRGDDSISLRSASSPLIDYRLAVQIVEPSLRAHPGSRASETPLTAVQVRAVDGPRTVRSCTRVSEARVAQVRYNVPLFARRAPQFFAFLLIERH